MTLSDKKDKVIDRKSLPYCADALLLLPTYFYFVNKELMYFINPIQSILFIKYI